MKLSPIASALAQINDANLQLASASGAITVASNALALAAKALAVVMIVVDPTGQVVVNAEFQKYLDQGGALYLPAGTYLVDAEVGLLLRSNTDLVMHPQANLIQKANAAAGSNVFLADRVHDVSVSGGSVNGDRLQHLGTTGEGGMGIRVRGAVRITIDNVKLCNFWGDGIVVGPYKGRPYVPSEQVRINGVLCQGNRRNGLSIGNVRGITVIDSAFVGNGLDPDGDGPAFPGTSPFCGIDIEPDPDSPLTSAAECHDVSLLRVLCSGNRATGVNVRHRVYGLSIDDSDLTDNGACGGSVVECHGFKLTNSRVHGNGATGVQVGAESDKVEVSGLEFYCNAKADARTTAIVGSGVQPFTKGDLRVAAADSVIGENTYR